MLATAVPLEVVQESRQLLDLCEAAARVAAPAVLADVTVAVRLAHAALEGAAATVRVALPSLNDRASAQRLEHELATASAPARPSSSASSSSSRRVCAAARLEPTVV